MSHIGHPLVADNMYGGKDVYLWQLQDEQPRAENPLIRRQALHAWKLEIDHPKTGERLKFEAPLYEDMDNLTQMLRKYRPVIDEKPEKEKTGFDPSRG
jgi:23S rRNA pseudouridine1911/1915/1917 synthase